MADDLFPEDSEPVFEPTLLPPNEATDQGSRWVRLAKIKRTLAVDHPWALMYHDLVTLEVLRARESGKPWNVREPLGMLILLEEQAIEQELMEPGEAPRYTPRQCVGQFALIVKINPIAVPLTAKAREEYEAREDAARAALA